MLDEYWKKLDEVPTIAGKPYVDRITVHGDASRLVLGWLASSTKAEKTRVYHAAGFEGEPNVRPIEEAAKQLFEERYPGRLPR